MRPQPLGAVLSISVDLESRGSASSSTRETPAATVERLADLFAATGQPVVWALSDPAGDRSVRAALEADPRHEVALLADPGWTIAGDGRGRWAAEMARRTAEARAAGLAVTTLALGNDALLPPGELLVKHGISAVRSAKAGGLRTASDLAASPTLLRYGLWQIEATLRLGGGSAMAQWIVAFQLRRAIDRSIGRGTLLHLVIDGPSLARESSGNDWRALRSVFRHIERRQKAGALNVLTIRETIARLAAPKSGRSAQSILRAA